MIFGATAGVTATADADADAGLVGVVVASSGTICGSATVVAWGAPFAATVAPPAVVVAVLVGELALVWPGGTASAAPAVEPAERAAAAIARGPADVPDDAAVVGGLAAGVLTKMTAATGFKVAAGAPLAWAGCDAPACALVGLDDVSLDLLSPEALPSPVCVADGFDVPPFAVDAGEPALRLAVCAPVEPASGELVDGGLDWSSDLALRGAGLSSGGGPAESCEAEWLGGGGGALTASGGPLSTKAPKLSLEGTGSGRAGLTGAFA